jgi:Peptide N-acetyl-beta-D-glucosaminyl asparaginase amidase A
MFRPFRVQSWKVFLMVFASFILVCRGNAQDSCPGPTIGSANTVTADPSVPRPGTQPCTVPLFTNIQFADFSPKSFSFAPPAGCPGPWAKVVFEGDFSINAGRQFDRTANIWIGGANIYFGTTAEPSATVSRCWHVERDLTDYSALFTSSQPGEVDLGNLVNSTYTSVITGSADLQFYPVAPPAQPPVTADVVLPLSAGPTGGTVSLSTSSDMLARSFSMPANVERAYLDVFAQSQSNDEFWYTCVPNDVATELQSCGATAFRETEVTIDGVPAGVAPVYPWIFTGGIDPFLWRPIPGVQTLNFIPYRVDLTPFAGVLSNGQTHQIALSVFNADFHFAVTASLLLYLDHGSSQVTGEVTENTIGPGPTPDVRENLTNTNGNIMGTVTVHSSRRFEVAGFVNTSHGKVRTEVEQKIKFANEQEFNISATMFVQDIKQKTNISSHTTTKDRGVELENSEEFEWPLLLDYSFVVNPDGSASQITVIRQEFEKERKVSAEDHPIFTSKVSNVVEPADTLLFSPSGAISRNQGQINSQRFFFRDSGGACFSRKIKAAGGLLTDIVSGERCDERDGDDDDDH